MCTIKTTELTPRMITLHIFAVSNFQQNTKCHRVLSTDRCISPNSGMHPFLTTHSRPPRLGEAPGKTTKVALQGRGQIMVSGMHPFLTTHPRPTHLGETPEKTTKGALQGRGLIMVSMV